MEDSRKFPNYTVEEPASVTYAPQDKSSVRGGEAKANRFNGWTYAKVITLSLSTVLGAVTNVAASSSSSSALSVCVNHSIPIGCKASRKLRPPFGYFPPLAIDYLADEFKGMNL